MGIENFCTGTVGRLIRVAMTSRVWPGSRGVEKQANYFTGHSVRLRLFKKTEIGCCTLRAGRLGQVIQALNVRRISGLHEQEILSGRKKLQSKAENSIISRIVFE